MTMDDLHLLIKRYAGKMPAREIAEMAGRSESFIRSTASDNGWSLAVPLEVKAKRIYYASAPLGQEEEIAEAVRTLIRVHGLPSQSAAIIKAIQVAAQVAASPDLEEGA